jgi:proline racemase
MRPKSRGYELVLADIAVGGDVHRIILSGIAHRAGQSALDLRNLIMSDYDELRQLLLSYPYGTEEMCADLIFESSDPRAAHGYVVMECMGYPYFSGSNTMAVMAALVEYGRAPAPEGLSAMPLEAPSGVVKGHYRIADGRIEEVSVEGDAAYVIADDLSVQVPGLGDVKYALVWSGACFVMVDAASFGIDIAPASLARMKQVGRAIVDVVRPTVAHRHPEIGPVDPPNFIHFMGPIDRTGTGRYRGHGVTYGHPATIFNCPTGTGTAARMALEIHRETMPVEAVFENTSAAGHVFIGQGLGDEMRGGQRMIATRISAKPYVLSTNRLHLDFENPVLAPYARLTGILEG